jgi:hypothetical protein
MREIDNWGQNILIPTKAEWEVLLRDKKYNGYEFSKSVCESAKRDLVSFESNPEVVLALVYHPRLSYMYLRLLHIDRVLYRVHFEDVICEHCNKRSGLSATPDFGAYVGAKREDEAREAMLKLPIMNCKNCGGKLSSRHTLWFAQQ